MFTNNLLGIDVGSTTVKVVVISPDEKIIYHNYKRHFSRVKECVLMQINDVKERFSNAEFKVCITGSAGLGLSSKSKLPFVQEVQAAFLAVKKYYGDADVVIELGGEDAKIIFLTGGVEQRMNGSCAGGTGAFIDQMAILLNIDVATMDEMSLKAEKIYPIASRCGVFAKSDIQPLLNQGARREDIAMSIYKAVVDQTIVGLAQGRKIHGKVLFLGGPLSFLKGLQKAFVDTLKLAKENAIFPEYASCFMAIGSALFADKLDQTFSIDDIEQAIVKADLSDEIITSDPLFKNPEEYEEFKKRHNKMDVHRGDLSTYIGKAYLGIDAGSTTTKMVLLGENEEILYSRYANNKGQPLEAIAEQLKELYAKSNAKMMIEASAVTGYGEDLIKSGIRADYGLVETVAHFKAASHFQPDVDFIIDIGGQDIKCFKIKNHAIDSIMLNEACSSGCGSFIQTFASALNIPIDEFSKLGLFAKRPVELGSRCTVFMNSSVKQAQKEGASIEDISSGLSSSIVKNAIYKVIRFKSPDDLGKNIVCQGGTFLNDAILRAFEREVGREVIRPSIAGLMGAFGAALYAKEKGGPSHLITESELESFSYKSLGFVCNGCTAHCNLTIVTFNNGGKYISGNRCEKGAGLKLESNNFNLFEYKYKRLFEGSRKALNPIATVGLPICLIFYEQLPLWRTFFEMLGFEVVISNESSRQLYFKGQHTIASDTVCYPAKLAHGHIEDLLDKDVNFIFYPSESYNLDEEFSDNHYNCPVVAYYPELLKGNNHRLTSDNFIHPYIDINNRKQSAMTLMKALSDYNFSKQQIYFALLKGFAALNKYYDDIQTEADRIVLEARKNNKKIIVVAGRPYHIDPEINHGVQKLLTSLDMAVITEDSVFRKIDSRVDVDVLNQWTYHSRLYRAAKYVTTQDDMQLVQLVSFGCGIDAITTDEVRRILEEKGKFYTQLKIDEISNLGAIKIRLRSLKAAMEQAKEQE